LIFVAPNNDIALLDFNSIPNSPASVSIHGRARCMTSLSPSQFCQKFLKAPPVW